VEFPLDLDLPGLMLAGLEATYPEDTPVEVWRDRLDRNIGPSLEDRKRLAGINWPTLASRALAVAATPKPMREVIKSVIRSSGNATPSDVLRAIEILLAARLLMLS
jgi:hypothetical protein